MDDWEPPYRLTVQAAAGRFSWARWISGAEVQIGDDLLYLGATRRVLSLDPYENGLGTPGTRIARSTDGWCMTLYASQGVWVIRP